MHSEKQHLHVQTRKHWRWHKGTYVNSTSDGNPVTIDASAWRKLTEQNFNAPNKLT